METMNSRHSAGRERKTISEEHGASEPTIALPSSVGGPCGLAERLGLSIAKIFESANKTGCDHAHDVGVMFWILRQGQGFKFMSCAAL